MTSQTVIGKLSGKKITIPDVNIPPMPSQAPFGVIQNGKKAENFGEIDASRGYPDVRSFKRKFGLFIPATNTSMEHELWSIIFKNQGPNGVKRPDPLPFVLDGGKSGPDLEVLETRGEGVLRAR